MAKPIVSLNLFLLLLTYISLFLYASGSPCNVPSRFWCDSEEIALNCGVYHQCQKYEWSLRQDVEPVQFTVYYESLCPDCKIFITEMLFLTFNKIGSIMNLTLVPYGNAKEKKVDDHWEFECQHGELECQGNLIETCAIAIIKDISSYFPFITCMEGSSEDPKTAAEQCARQSKQFSVPLQQILNCSISDYGNQLEHEMAVKTDALTPRHLYVPWVTLNGVHTDKIQEAALADLVKLICDTYKGPKPSGCSQ